MGTADIDEDDGTLNIAMHENSGVTDQGANLEKKNTLTIININARSLCPKVDSLIDCFQELTVDIAVITETWLKDGPDHDKFVTDLELGAGLSVLSLNRAPNPATGVAHGGVSVIYKKKIGCFKPLSSGLL